jgi:hypothetical protein
MNFRDFQVFLLSGYCKGIGVCPLNIDLNNYII